MKTQPTKLLLALIFGFTSLAFVSAPTFASDSDSYESQQAKSDKDAKDAKDAKDTKDAKDSKDAKDAQAAKPNCTSSVVTACNTKLVKTNCTVAIATPTAKDKDDKDAKDSNDKAREDSSNDSKDSGDSKDSNVTATSVQTCIADLAKATGNTYKEVSSRSGARTLH